MATTLRPITPEDLEAYKEIRLRALRDAPLAFGSTFLRESRFSEAEWLERIARSDGKTGIAILALDDDVPCGLVGGFLDRTDPGTAALVSMWVAPSHRQRGIGRALVEAASEWAASRGARAVTLMVTSTNDEARRFYAGLGFALTGVNRPYAKDPAITELEMRRAIPPG